MSQTRLKKNYDNPIKEVDNEENTFTFYGTQKAITHDDSQTDFINNEIVEGINKIVKNAVQRPK
jgi:hypothetical protein